MVKSDKVVILADGDGELKTSDSDSTRGNVWSERRQGRWLRLFSHAWESQGCCQVREPHGTLHKEHRGIIAVGGCEAWANHDQWRPKGPPDDISVTPRGAKLGSKPTDVTYSVCTTSIACCQKHGNEQQETKSRKR